jgi:hypothetical protein
MKLFIPLVNWMTGFWSLNKIPYFLCRSRSRTLTRGRDVPTTGTQTVPMTARRHVRSSFGGEEPAMTDPHGSVEVPVRKTSLAKRVRLPRLSGKASAAWLAVCFALTAVLIPMALRLPRWVEFEIVLALWWVIWLAVLTRLLYTGQRVADDHQLREPRNWFSSSRSEQKEQRNNSDGGWWDGFFWDSFLGDAERIAVGCLVVIGLILLAGLVWFLIEVAIPLVLFVLYFVTRGMLAQVVNDRHHCRGHLGRAISWGFVWATAYTVPLGAGVWFVHYAHQKSQIGL